MKDIVKQVSKDLEISSGEAELIVASLLEKPRFGIYFNNKFSNLVSKNNTTADQN